jgi:FixJ family two-component response regulator
MPATIAIIDDDDDVRESTRQLLRSRGYLTLAFASAEEFLRSGEVIQVACVVTDVRMPGMDGVALQARLIAQGNSVPVIFVTAFPEQRVKDRVLAAGARGFLVKPYQEASLIGCIETTLKASPAAGA